jgi:hypothetical protein
MTDEPTNAPDTQGTETNTPVETPEKSLPIVEEARKIRDDIAKLKEELAKQVEKIDQQQAEQMLGGTSGGNVPVKEIPEAERKKAQAKEFFKGTELEEAIDKYNE